jgi:Ca2+-transporting ATPase
LLRAADGLAAQGLRVLAVASGLDGAPRHPERNSSSLAASSQEAGSQEAGCQAAGCEAEARSRSGQGSPAPKPGSGTDEQPADVVHDYLFEPIGLVGLADPLRPEVPAAIALARGAGVRVVMITGDAPLTARSIAEQAGLPAGPVLSGSDLRALEAGEPPGRPGDGLAAVSVFARVLPQQKLQIVRALQAAGEVVAMTGDGVNDAPALKAADIGVAMGKRGTAVARESADLVLLGDDFGSLVKAIALGRRIENNLHRALGYTLAIHLPIAAVSLLPLLVPGQPLLLLPVHIALLHLVIDPACTVVFEALPASPGLMRQPPRPPEAPLFGAATWRKALLQGGVLAVLALSLACWPGFDLEGRRSLVFSLLLLGGGVLVWLNGEPRSRLSQFGGAIGLGLWLLLQAVPGLNALLLLRPLPGLIPFVLPVSLLLLVLPLLLGRFFRAQGAEPVGIDPNQLSG